MPIHDAPCWTMPERVADAVAEVAPAQRVFLEQLMATLGREGANVHDRISFGAEVLAAQLNLLADKLRERRREVAPDRERVTSDSDFIHLMAQDIIQRALMRRVRGED